MRIPNWFLIDNNRFLLREKFLKCSYEFFSWNGSNPLLDYLSFAIQQEKLWLVSKIKLFFETRVCWIIHIQVYKIDFAIIFCF